MMRATVQSLAELLVRLMHILTRRLADDRGDVPGWVLVTVMTAGLVTGLWVVADEQLTSLLSRAITAVSK
jgi:hypothetical protein